MSRAKDLAIALTAMGVAWALPAAAKAQEQQQGERHESAALDSVLSGAAVTLRVDGMSCPFCAYGLEKRLKKIAAIDSVLIRVSDGLVQIRVKDGQALDDEALHEAVERAGFSLREITRVEN